MKTCSKTFRFSETEIGLLEAAKAILKVRSYTEAIVGALEKLQNPRLYPRNEEPIIE